MIRHFVLLALLAFSSGAAACDLCACYLGINPTYNRHTLNVRYRISSFAGNHSHLITAAETGTHHHQRANAGAYMHEYFETVELWGRFYPTPKLQVIASLPVARNMETYAGRPIAEVSGLRDAFALAQYQVINRNPVDSGAFRHRLLLGGGVKLPTGNYEYIADDGTWNPLLQPGTGSWDAMLAATWLGKINRWGASADMVYTYATRNNMDYRFANRLNVTAHLFYGLPLGPLTFMPFAGAYLETAGTDDYTGIEQLNTGGTVGFASGGCQLYWKRFSATATVQQPMHEWLNGDQGVNETRYMVGIGYALNK